MSKENILNRRRFLKTSVQTGVFLAAPQVIPGTVFGKDGSVPPSERIRLGAIGIGGRGRRVLGNFLQQPDLQCVAICDVRGDRRQRAKNQVDARYGNKDCTSYTDFRELLARDDIDAVLIATGSNWHATIATMAAKAGIDVYCEKPCTKNIAESLALADVIRRTGRVFQAGTHRRSIPHFAYAVELARSGKLGPLQTLHAWGRSKTKMSGWLPAESEPSRKHLDWDMYLGPAAWRPYNRRHITSAFDRGGIAGTGCLDIGAHCVDLCQWANDADGTAPVEYEPVKGQLHARYANGVKLVVRDKGWLPLGSCPVRFEGETDWIATGDDSEFATSSQSLLLRRGTKIPGYPADFHVRNFLDCIKTRAQPRANAEVACGPHIACHAVNIAAFLNRKVRYDPRKNEFIGDEQANRLRSEALRGPWRI